MSQQDLESSTPDKASLRDAARQLLDLGQLSTDELGQVFAVPNRPKRFPWARLFVSGFAIIVALLAVGLAAHQEKPNYGAQSSR
jgi:hypothetical protein